MDAIEAAPEQDRRGDEQRDRPEDEGVRHALRPEPHISLVIILKAQLRDGRERCVQLCHGFSDLKLGPRVLRILPHAAAGRPLEFAAALAVGHVRPNR
eukprot:10742791-Prorocentrum_lima.AAC.1